MFPEKRVGGVVARTGRAKNTAEALVELSESSRRLA
jgi:hypothetical protein